jgi:hypothetical protein
VADVENALLEVDVHPAQAEELLQAQSGEGGGREDRPVARQGGVEECAELLEGEHARVALRLAPRELVGVEAAERVVADHAAADGECEHPPQRGEHALARPGGEPLGLLLAQEAGE